MNVTIPEECRCCGEKFALAFGSKGRQLVTECDCFPMMICQVCWKCPIHCEDHQLSMEQCLKVAEAMGYKTTKYHEA